MKFFYLLLLPAVLFSCKKSIEPEVKEKSFKNILILGNSITRHAPAPQMGWYGNWGMAASSAEKDYVHLLMAKFRNLDAEAKVTYINLSGYEAGYWAYNLSAIDTIVSDKQDLIILRLAENVNQAYISDHDFHKHYTRLIEYLKARNPDAKVICTAGFWNNPPVERVIHQSASDTNSSFVSLASLDKGEFTAWTLFPDPAVAAHPGDKGMQAIADLIWTEVERVRK